jgi:superoxide reductase
MTEKKQVYKCEICGNIVEVVHNGVGTLVCCGQSMGLQTENTVDAATEKHVPVIVKEGTKTTVKVGSVDHPMDEEHYIEWIEAHVGEKIIRKYLSPGEKPELVICSCEDCKCEADCVCKEEITGARAYCNLHGLWKNE